MDYKFGWESTPEIEGMYQHHKQMQEKLEKELLHIRRIEKIVMGVALFFWALTLFIPLIMRLK